MAKNILARILQAILVMLGVALLIFIMLRIVPGNAIVTMMGEHAKLETIERMTRELGLDQPVYVQFWRYITGALRGDFGTSYALNRSVSELIGLAFPNTLRLAVAAAIVAWITGIICGIIAAVKKNGILDHLFMGFSLLGVSVPVFMVAMVLQYFLAYRLKLLPISGVDSWQGYILPAIALGWNSAGSIARLTRSTLLEVLQEDYIDTARAKGHRQLGVITVHALRNALLPGHNHDGGAAFFPALWRCNMRNSLFRERHRAARGSGHRGARHPSASRDHPLLNAAGHSRQSHCRLPVRGA